MEQPTNLMMITGVIVLDGPLDFERLLQTVEQRLGRAQVFRTEGEGDLPLGGRRQVGGADGLDGDPPVLPAGDPGQQREGVRVVEVHGLGVDALEGVVVPQRLDDLLAHRISALDDDARAATFYRPPQDSPEIVYLHQRRLLPTHVIHWAGNVLGIVALLVLIVGGGIHGANRLMGNSLLDIIVFGRIAGTNAAQFALSNAQDGALSLDHVAAYNKEVIDAGVSDGRWYRGGDPVLLEPGEYEVTVQATGYRLESNRW